MKDVQIDKRVRQQQDDSENFLKWDIWDCWHELDNIVMRGVNDVNEAEFAIKKVKIGLEKLDEIREILDNRIHIHEKTLFTKGTTGDLIDLVAFTKIREVLDDV